MARLIIPDSFISQLTLLSNIKAKNDADGAAGPLAAFLTQQGIILDDDVAAGNAAQTHEINRNLLGRQSENYRQLRDNYFKNAWSQLTGSVQFLKQFYKGNAKELGNWGFAVTASGKINYPPAFIDRIPVFTALLEKHNSYPAGASPLQPYVTQQNIDLASDAGFVEQAAGANTNFIAAARQSENETQLSNQLWQPVLTHIRDMGNYLMKLYTNNPKALGAWGFVVDDSTKKPRLRTTKLKLEEKITNKSVVIGSTVTNIGEVDLHLYKGAGTSGTPATIHTGEQFGITKGYGTITIVNPSRLIEGKFTVMVSST